MIDSELDMDIAIQRILRLAAIEGTKYVTVIFPSEAFHLIFMQNLHDKVMETDLDLPMDIELSIHIRSNNDE